MLSAMRRNDCPRWTGICKAAVARADPNIDPAPWLGSVNYGQPFMRTDLPKWVRILRLKPRVTRWVIPPKANRKTPRSCDFALCCERNLVERFFNKLKHFRAIATRYDKLARNFLAGIQLACTMILLN
jgi:hypothetical protein